MKRFVLLVLPVCVAYAGTLVWIGESWMQPESYYSHGPLVPLLAVLLVWWRRDRWRAAELGSSARGWWLLGPGLLLHLCAAALTIDSLSALSLVLTVPGLALLAVGRARMRGMWPVVALLLFALPPPMFVTGRVAFELKELAIDAALAVCGALGVAAERSYAQIVIAGQPGALEVAPACSGLRSLVALATLGFVVAFFFGSQTGPRRWILLAASVPIAVAANVLRIAGICALASWQGVQFASTTGHSILNVVEWVVALGLLLVIDVLLSRGSAGSQT